jgi:hypothetical protein
MGYGVCYLKHLVIIQNNYLRTFTLTWGGGVKLQHEIPDRSP